MRGTKTREEQKQMIWGENINIQFKEMPEVHATSIQTFQPFKITALTDLTYFVEYRMMMVVNSKVHFGQ